MKQIIHAALIASTSFIAMSNTALGQASLLTGGTGIPVEDAKANVSLWAQLGQQVKMVASLAQQITALTQLVSLATVASTVLGDTVDPALGQLFTDTQNAYMRSNQAYGSLMAVPGKIDQELSLFEEPPGGWESMSLPQAITRAKRIRELTLGTNSAAVSRQADMIERRVQIAEQQALANGMADKAVSALSATQAVAQQMRVTGRILSDIEQTQSDMATAIAMKINQENADREVGEAFALKDAEAMKQMINEGPGRPDSNPLLWGR